VRLPILSQMALLAVLAATPADAATLETITESSQQVLDVKGLRRLHVDNPRGLVRVRESADGRLHLTAYKLCRGKDAAEARRYASETQVTSVREGDRHVLRVTYPRKIRIEVSWWDVLKGDDLSDLSKPRAEVRLLIELPRALAAELRTASGDVDAQGDFTSLEAITASGDIVFRGLDARLRTSSGEVSVLAGRRVSVSSSSGDCEADSVDGRFVFETSSGDLTLGYARDSVRVRTASGDVAIQQAARGLDGEVSSGQIDVAAAGGPIRLVSTSGDVSVAAVAPFAGVDVSTSSGELTVRLPHGAGARLEASTSSGSIDCSLPITLERSDRRHLSGRIGSGGPSVRLSSASGDIVVTSGGR